MLLLCIAEAERAGMLYEKGVYLDALFFDASELRKLQINVKNKATVDAHVNMSLGQFLIVRIHHSWCRVHGITVSTYSAWGFCVARSDIDGQCEGLEAWNG